MMWFSTLAAKQKFKSCSPSPVVRSANWLFPPSMLIKPSKVSRIKDPQMPLMRVYGGRKAISESNLAPPEKLNDVQAQRSDSTPESTRLHLCMDESPRLALVTGISIAHDTQTHTYLCVHTCAHTHTHTHNHHSIRCNYRPHWRGRKSRHQQDEPCPGLCYSQEEESIDLGSLAVGYPSPIPEQEGASASRNRREAGEIDTQPDLYLIHSRGYRKSQPTTVQSPGSFLLKHKLKRL